MYSQGQYFAVMFLQRNRDAGDSFKIKEINCDARFYLEKSYIAYTVELVRNRNLLLGMSYFDSVSRTLSMTRGTVML